MSKKSKSPRIQLRFLTVVVLLQLAVGWDRGLLRAVVFPGCNGPLAPGESERAGGLKGYRPLPTPNGSLHVRSRIDQSPGTFWYLTLSFQLSAVVVGRTTLTTFQGTVQTSLDATRILPEDTCTVILHGTGWPF